MDARSRLSIVGLLLAVVSLGLVGVAPNPAAGNPIADKRAEAERIADEVSRLNHEIEAAAEEYGAAAARLNDLRDQIDAARASIAQTQAEMASRQDQLQVFAVEAYIQGGHDGTLPVILNSDGSDIGQRQGYLSAAVGDRQQLLDALEATRDDVEAKTKELEKSEGEAAKVAERLEGRKRAAEAADAEQKALLARTQGELADLVRQEEQRRAAENERRAAERERAASTRSTSRRSSASVAATPAPAPNGGAATAIAVAMDQLGTPYRWGGASQSGFDCSGLTMYAWAAASVSLPHNSRMQYAATRHISVSDIQPGDLVFYGSPIHHVGLYIGNNQIVHAPHSGDVVKVSSLYYVGNIAGVGRVG